MSPLLKGAGILAAAAVLSMGVRERNRILTVSRPPAAPALGAPFDFVEAAAAAGLSFTPGKFEPHPSLTNIAPRLGSLGVSVAVVDFDSDGRPDVFVANPRRGGANRLFRNRGDGTFTDVAAGAGLARAAGAAGSMRAVFFDSRNDGNKDLLLTTTSGAVFLKNTGGRFMDETARSGLGHRGFSYASNVIDYDGDGFLDVVIADYFKPTDFIRPRDYDFMPDSAVAADNGGPIVVYHNERDGTFSRVEGNLGIESRGWTLAVGVYDLRGSGRRDLYFATDFNSDQIYFNEGGGRFSSGSGLVADKYSRNGMSAEIADVDNDGRAAVFVTNIHAPPYSLGRNMLWKWDPRGRFVDQAAAAGVGECGWSWGAKFLDLDNDGLQDLIVSNGYISADRKRDYWYESGLMGAAAGVISRDARNWPPMGNASLGGYQKKCVYRNAGWGFEDVTDRTAWASDLSDGRGLAAIDHLSDGSLSVIEANEGQPLRFYRNAAPGKNRWIGFQLTGVRSGRDAFGARVEVRLEGKTLSRELQPANGFMAQSDSRLHFGLGSHPRPREVLIRWPSGIEQRLENPALDRYHPVTEPSGAEALRQNRDRKDLVLQPRPGWVPVPGAPKLTLLFLVEKTRIMAGEGFRYRLEFQNTGTSALSFKESAPSFMKTGFNCEEQGFKFFVTPPGGKERALACRSKAGGKGEDSLDLSLAPGEYLLTAPGGAGNPFREYKTKFKFDKTGVYSLRALYTRKGIEAESKTVSLEVVR